MDVFCKSGGNGPCQFVAPPPAWKLDGWTRRGRETRAEVGLARRAEIGSVQVHAVIVEDAFGVRRGPLPEKLKRLCFRVRRGRETRAEQ